MAENAVILHVFGKVQGVGFRYYTNKKAIELNIRGFVKNMPDGTVHIEAEGDSDNLEMFINWCEIGPSWARVSKLTRENVAVTNFTIFQVK